MKRHERKPVAPFYAIGALWLLSSLVMPLFRLLYLIPLGVVSVGLFALLDSFCKKGGVIGNAAEKEPEVKKTEEKKQEPVKQPEPQEESTGNPELDKAIKDGKLAIAEMKRLNANIPDPGITADINALEATTAKIFAEVKRSPNKLPQIRRFMDYYLPTTIKILNSYDRMNEIGVSGENIDGTKEKVEAILRNIVAAFDKQLDSLYGAEAMDISTDITVMETMLAREGLGGVAAATEDGSIELKL